MAMLFAQRSIFTARTAAPAVSRVSLLPNRATLSVVRPSQNNSNFLGGSFVSGALGAPKPMRGALVISANAKASLGCTKRGTNRKRRRVSGFKKRMATPAGRKILAARRAKGRHVLVPASEGKSGGKK